MDQPSPGPVNLDGATHLATCSEWLNFIRAKSQSQLRGGQRDVSQAWSESQVEIRDEPIEEPTQPKGDKVYDETIFSAETQNFPVVKVESPDVKLETLPRYVPLEQHDISRASYTPLARASPTISVAHRKLPQTQPASKSADDELKKNPFTGIQQRIMQRMSQEDQIIDMPPSATFKALELSADVSDGLAQKVNGKRSKEEYDGPLGFYEKIAQKRKAEQAVTELAVREPSLDSPAEVATLQQQICFLNPVAREFESPIAQEASDVHQQSKAEVPIITTIEEVVEKPHVSLDVSEASENDEGSKLNQMKADILESIEEGVSEKHAVGPPENHQTRNPAEDVDEARSEGGLDITPMLKALGARADTASPAVSVKSAVVEGSVRKNSESFKPDTLQLQEVTSEHDNLADQDSSSQEETPYQARTVLLGQLPSDIGYSDLSSLVSGGRIQSMTLQRETSTACVTFMNSEDACRYARDRTLGLSHKHHSHLYKISVELLPQTDSPDAVLQAYNSCGATRVIEVEDIADEHTITALYKLASGLFGRQIECIVDTYKATQRMTCFRFTGVQDAVDFRSMLTHSRQWKKHSIHFGEDPCLKSS